MTPILYAFYQRIVEIVFLNIELMPEMKFENHSLNKNENLFRNFVSFLF